MWQNHHHQPYHTSQYPQHPPRNPHPHQIHPHLLPPLPYHHLPHHPNLNNGPPSWLNSYPAQPPYQPSTNLRNNPSISNLCPFQAKPVPTINKDQGLVARQKQEQKIRTKHLIKMLSLGPPPPPSTAAPAGSSAGQPGRRWRGGRRRPVPGCGGGRGSVLNTRLGRVYGQLSTSEEKCEEESLDRNAEQSELETEERGDNVSNQCGKGQMTDDNYSTINPPSSVASHSLLNINLPPHKILPPPSSRCSQPSNSDIPSLSCYPLPPPSGKLPTLDSSHPPPRTSHPLAISKCTPPVTSHPPPITRLLPPSASHHPPSNIHPPPIRSHPPPIRSHTPPIRSLPPPSSHAPTSSSHPPPGYFPPLRSSLLPPLVRCPPPGSCLPPPPPTNSLPGSTNPPPPEHSSLYTRRPSTQAVRTCDWKPMRTVDYEGVWAPGVVTEYRDKVVDEGVFQPEMFDYGHGGEERGETKEEKPLDTNEGNDKEEEEGESSSEKRGYSRKRLVGFF